MSWNTFFKFNLGDHIHPQKPHGQPASLLPQAIRVSPHDSATETKKGQLREEITLSDRKANYTQASSALIVSLLGIKSVINNDNTIVNIVFGCLTVLVSAVATFMFFVYKNTNAEKIVELTELTSKQSSSHSARTEDSDSSTLSSALL